MRHLLIFICLLLLTSICVSASGEECYKPAPEPIYTEERDYGYNTDVPCDNDEYIHSIMKTWQNGGTRYIFVDLFKDGVCDVVYKWVQEDRTEDAWMLVGTDTCEEVDRNIITQIKFKQGLSGE